MLNSFIIAFLFSFALNLFFAPLGKRMRVLKSSGREPERISKLGGVGIAGSFYLAVIFVMAHTSMFDRRSFFLLISAGLTFVLGFFDDLHNFTPSKKLFFQFFIVVILVAAGIRTEIIFLSRPLNVLLSIFWLLAIMNAFNLLDILDGLAAGIVSICAGTFLFISCKTGNYAAGIISAALLGSNLSFLRFNFSPARLYMGDMGSLFNGIVLGAVAIMISYAPAKRESALFAPLLILAFPLYDLFFVVTMRIINHKSIIEKSRDHFVLRLTDRGVAVPGAVFLMYLFNVLFNCAALFLLRSSNTFGFLILSITVIVWLVVAYRVSGRIVANEL